MYIIIILYIYRRRDFSPFHKTFWEGLSVFPRIEKQAGLKPPRGLWRVRRGLLKPRSGVSAGPFLGTENEREGEGAVVFGILSIIWPLSCITFEADSIRRPFWPAWIDPGLEKPLKSGAAVIFSGFHNEN
ncbi:MAG: hypothetical protein LBR53_03745 [Deltaproteobacteria bacterium]|jgi:hypothetical protein|nr:hypothetical protein [Deltaproteobacteria bacterium]